MKPSFFKLTAHRGLATAKAGSREWAALGKLKAVSRPSNCLRIVALAIGYKEEAESGAEAIAHTVRSVSAMAWLNPYSLCRRQRQA
jgi:hypothetical protein